MTRRDEDLGCPDREDWGVAQLRRRSNQPSRFEVVLAGHCSASAIEAAAAAAAKQYGTRVRMVATLREARGWDGEAVVGLAIPARGVLVRRPPAVGSREIESV